MEQYNISISLSDKTLQALYKSGWQLQVFKGVKGAGAGKPILWYALTEFSSKIALKWGEQFGGYVSNQRLVSGVTVDVSSYRQMEPGQRMTLNPDGTTAVSTLGGKSGAFTFHNAKKEEWLCGITQSVNGSQPSPLCAFHLYGLTFDFMEPYEKIVLVFASTPVDTGTVIEEALAASVEIVLSPDQPNIELGFDMNESWDSKGSQYVKVHPEPIQLASALIIPWSGE